MSKSKPRHHDVPDGGWGWLACLASFWTNGVVFGIVNSFGVLYVAILDKTGGTAFEISWIGSLCGALTFFMCPFASILTDKIGCRPAAVIGGALALVGVFSSSFATRIEFMYITYGFLQGLGFGIAYQPSLVILGMYFKKRLGIANGLATFGSAAFTIALPFVVKKILERWGLQSCLWFQSVIVLVMLLGGVTFRPPDETGKDTSNTNEPLDSSLCEDVEFCRASAEESTLKTVESKKRQGCIKSCGTVIDFSIWKERSYVLWTLGLTIGLMGYFAPFFHLIKHVNDTIPDAPAELLITCLGATSGVGRLVAGFVSDHPKINPIRIQQLAFLVIGTSTLIVPVIHNFVGLCVLFLIMGFFDGAFVSLLGVIAFNLVGKERASQAIGAILGLVAIPMLLGPPVAGFLYDILGTYDIAFFCAGVPPILGACILFLIHKHEEDSSDIHQSATNGEIRVHRDPGTHHPITEISCNGETSSSALMEPTGEHNGTVDNDHDVDQSGKHVSNKILRNSAISNHIPTENPNLVKGCTHRSNLHTNVSPNCNTDHPRRVISDPSSNGFETGLSLGGRPNGFIRNPGTDLNHFNHTCTNFETIYMLSSEKRQPKNLALPSNGISTYFVPNTYYEKESVTERLVVIEKVTSL